MRYESIELNNETRKTLPGEFIQLSDGFVHYELAGPVNGDVVVLVHGISAPMFVWDFTFKMLVQKGFRTLRYDLYGRGTSDRPQINYNFDLFIRQLLQLVSQLGLSKNKINLVGLSSGGGICVIFADQYPDLVKKVSLLGPVGFPNEENTYSVSLSLNHRRLIELQRMDFYQFEDNIEEYLEKYAEQMKFQGFLQAIESTIQNTASINLKETYERIEKRKLPMQLFWGEKDQIIPFTTSQKVISAVPSIEFHTIKESGHMPHYTHPEVVNPLLLEFLRD